MPEHDCLPPDVSATDFVVHMARMSGLPRAAARERAADMLRHVGLYEERYRPMGGYSTGMKQRAKLAQALAHDPQLVLLDEPTNGLDPAASRRHARPGPPHRPGLRHLGARHVPPARRARARQRPRRRPRRRAPAALVGDHASSSTSPARCWSRSSAPTRRRGGAGLDRRRRAGPARGSLLALDPPATRTTSRPHPRHRLELGLGLVRIQADHRRFEDVYGDELTSGPPQDEQRRAGVIHDIGYRPYSGPRAGRGAIACALFLTASATSSASAGRASRRCCRSCCW